MFCCRDSGGTSKKRGKGREREGEWPSLLIFSSCFDGGQNVTQLVDGDSLKVDHVIICAPVLSARCLLCDDADVWLQVHSMYYLGVLLSLAVVC